MPSKKNKKKRQIQERQTALKTGSLEKHQASLLQQRLLKLEENHRSERQELSQLRSEHASLLKENANLERKLKGSEKLTVDMHANHVKMRQALADIRDLHMYVNTNSYVHHKDGTVERLQKCGGCGEGWPCATYRKIQMPEHLIVSSLIEMERELAAKED